MNETFERDVIDRLARIETRLEGMNIRLNKVEGGNYRPLPSLAGGSIGAFIMGGVAVFLKLMGWL